MLKLNAASIPRSEKIQGRAICVATDPIGACVSVSSDKIGNKYVVSLTDVFVDMADQSVGVIIRKDSPTDCVVQFMGPVIGVYTGLVPGRRYYVGVGSLLAAMAPVPAFSGVAYVQVMGVATGANELLLNPQTPIKRVG